MRKWRKRGLVILGVISALLLAAASMAQTGDTVCFIPWGDAAGEAGLISGPEREPVGIISFAADGKNIFLLDAVRKCIIRKTGDKKATVLTDKVIATSLCADGQGGVYILSEGAIIPISPKGEKGISEKVKAASGKSMIEGYGTELMFDSSGALNLRTVKQDLFDFADSGKIRSDMVLSGPSYEWRIKRGLKNQVRILGSDKDGKIMKSIPVKVDNARLGAAIFKGVDKDGDVYVEVEAIRDGKAELEVHRYSMNGERKTVYLLPNNYFTTVYKKTEISPSGEVYHMLTTEDGVKITRYGKEG